MGEGERAGGESGLAEMRKQWESKADGAGL